MLIFQICCLHVAFHNEKVDRQLSSSFTVGVALNDNRLFYTAAVMNKNCYSVTLEKVNKQTKK